MASWMQNASLGLATSSPLMSVNLLAFSADTSPVTHRPAVNMHYFPKLKLTLCMIAQKLSGIRFSEKWCERVLALKL